MINAKAVFDKRKLSLTYAMCLVNTNLISQTKTVFY